MGDSSTAINLHWCVPIKSVPAWSISSSARPEQGKNAVGGNIDWKRKHHCQRLFPQNEGGRYEHRADTTNHRAGYRGTVPLHPQSHLSSIDAFLYRCGNAA